MKEDNMRFIDSHVHLTDKAYLDQIREIVKLAKETKIVAMITNAENLETSLRALKLSAQYPEIIYAAIGIQPRQAPADVNNIESVNLLVRENSKKIIAVGEIGLDKSYTKNERDLQIQRHTFQTMLNAAEKADLPVVIHSRQSVNEVLDEVQQFNLKHVVLHWYSGPTELLSEISSRGYYITIGPSINYAKHIQKIADHMPVDLILTETDGPVRYRGPYSKRPTTPDLVRSVVEKLAEIKQICLTDLTHNILRNNLSAFPKLRISSNPYLNEGHSSTE